MRINKTTSGQSMLEFALVLPIFILLMMGLFDIGRAIFYYSTLNSAVREGSRLAVVQSDCDYRSDPSNCSGSYLEAYPLNCSNAVSTANIKVCNAIASKFFNVGSLPLSTILIDHLNTGSKDPEIKISIDYVFKPITPGIALMGDLTMQVNSRMLRTPLAKP